MKSTHHLPVYRSAAKQLALTIACTGLLLSSLGIENQGATARTRRPASYPTSQAAPARRPARLPAPVGRAVIQDASQRLGVPANNVRIVQARSRTFGNDCEFRFGEACTRQYAPVQGWEVVVRSGRQFIIYHTDRSGSQVIPDPATLASNPSPNPNPTTLPVSVSRAVLQDASQRSGVPVANLRVAQSSSRTFNNACEFNFGQVCTREYQPIVGWVVTVQGQQQTWNYHADRTGSQVVLDPGTVGNNTALPLPIQQAVLQDAAQRSGVPAASVRIVQATPKTFGNQCLFDFGQVCTREYRPIEGWEILVQVQTQTWTYHADRGASQIAIDPSVGSPTGTLPANVRTAVLRDASQWTQTPISAIRIIDAQPKTWGNACDFGFGKVCTMDYRPVSGWEVKVSNGSLNWTYRANQNGTTVMMDQRQALPPEVANAIVQDATRRAGSAIRPGSLRFIEVREDSRRVCSFLGINCRSELTWLAVVSDGRQQWGYQSDAQGQRVQTIPVAQVLQPIGTR